MSLRSSRLPNPTAAPFGVSEGVTLDHSGPRRLVTAAGRTLSVFRFPGKGRAANLLGQMASRVSTEAYCFPAPGAPVAIRLTERIERLMWASCYERELVAILSRILETGMVFLDVGAHIGYFSALAGFLVGTTGQVHSFEADPDCFQRLALNCRMNSSIHVHHAAITDRTGTQVFHRSCWAGESGWGSLFGEGAGRQTLEVPTTTLEDWWYEEAPWRIDFIKMDVEGAEYRALCGAAKVLRKARPMLFFEVNDVCLARDGRTHKDVFRLLVQEGYELLGVASGRARRVENIAAVPCERADWKEKLLGMRLDLKQIVLKDV